MKCLKFLLPVSKFVICMFELDSFVWCFIFIFIEIELVKNENSIYCAVSVVCGHKNSFNLSGSDSCCQRVVPVFDNLVDNERSNDIEAEFLDHKYILPKKSCFCMVWIRTLIFLKFMRR